MHLKKKQQIVIKLQIVRQNSFKYDTLYVFKKISGKVGFVMHRKQCRLCIQP